MLEAPEEERRRVTQVATRQMRLISIGRDHWLD
ncbi:putative TetR-family transcriptional regulator [Streptomyces viridochromogenes Tue57]|uniref:Putative TetR-family transcriptional regulator n=1 Tax=Streptomyces viridochromogenes Tue57 TaxID=1160705 RepID=L8PK34_STRVR|nr:putative TetR-family transcriptional regulator [Streptomyces viridochromogenes Tue57]